MAYLGKTPSQAVRQRYYFTASGGETSLSGADDNGNTLNFTDGAYVDVYLNGVLLVAGTDYNTSTANTIGGLTALSASDVVELVVYDTFAVFGGEVQGDFNVTNGNLTVDTDTLYVDSTNDRVGIGTSSPDTNLEMNLGTGSYLQVMKPADNEVRLRNYKGGDTAFQSLSLQASDIAFRTGTAGGSSAPETMRIDSSGAVLINNTSPVENEKLRVTGNDGELALDPADFFSHSVAIFENDGECTVTIASDSASSGLIRFTDVDRNSGEIEYDHNGDYMAFSTDGQEAMRIDSDGRLLVGTSATYTSDGRIQANVQGISVGAWVSEASSTVNRNHMRFRNPNGVVGSISTSGSATSYNESSDYRLKENVVDMTGAIDRVKALSPKRFNFIADPDTTVDGFIAHEAQAVVPESVHGTYNEVEVWQEDEELPEGVSVGDNKLDENGNTIPVYQGIDKSKLVPLLTAALQEAIVRIETLEAEVATLKGASS
jgi:hypothetical protein